MKIRIITAFAALMLLVFGATTINVYADAPQVQVPPATEIQRVLTDMLPVFENLYGYDLVTDLNRAGLDLTDFARHLHNYLVFLYDAEILDLQALGIDRPNWVYYFVDGIVMEMSESPSSAWGNVSLKGLVLNNIYVNVLGLEFLAGFFAHDSITFLAENLHVAAYFDFLMSDASIGAILPFGAAAREHFEYGESEGLSAIIGIENVAALGQMHEAWHMGFLAGLLIDRMAGDLQDIIDEYAGFVVIPSTGMVMPISISEDSSERWRIVEFSRDITLEVATDINNEYLDIFINNTSYADLFMTLQTYDAYGEWHIYIIEFVPAGLSVTQILPPDVDLDNFFRITIFSANGGVISGEIEIGIWDN